MRQRGRAVLEALAGAAPAVRLRAGRAWVAGNSRPAVRVVVSSLAARAARGCSIRVRRR